MRLQGANAPLLEAGAAWLLALLWVLPLAYAIWAAVHPATLATHFDPFAPLTLANFRKAWTYAPFARHFLNTVLLVTMILAAQLVLCTLAASPSRASSSPGTTSRSGWCSCSSW